jgi:SAM-dependent methyltransferase
MKLAILLVSRNRPDLVEAMVAQIAAKVTVPHDLFLVECGTDPQRLTPHTTAWYPDADFRGKCYGHNVALQFARLKGRYDYYWVLMNDLVFEGPEDPARTLIETLDREERMAILSPCDNDAPYPASRRVPGGDWRPVTTCDYLGFMMKGAALEEVGFLDPGFKYCWGAIHDLAHRLNRAGWFLAYSDRTAYKHLGGTTYGAQNTQTISRDEYQRQAKRQAYDTFVERYGQDWDEQFWAAAAPFGPQANTFAMHRRYWLEGFDAGEQAERLRAWATARADATAAAGALADGQVRLHLGCGTDKRAGWVNVDLQPEVRPDVVASVDDLPMFGDATVDVVEANHLFEHLTLTQARKALREWARVLRPGGRLVLELPDMQASLRMLGRYRDAGGFDLGMVGLYGWTPDIDAAGVPQMHKWGWTRESLAAELLAAGFADVRALQVTQTGRPAARFGRDMRLCAARAGTVAAAIPADHAAAEPAPVRAEPPQLFAWPDWSSAAELELLMDGFARPLADHPGSRLVLRHDARIDPPREAALAALRRAYESTMDGRDLDVLVLDASEGEGDWARIGQDLHAVAALPSTAQEARQRGAAALGRPFADDAAWRRWLVH